MDDFPSYEKWFETKYGTLEDYLKKRYKFYDEWPKESLQDYMESTHPVHVRHYYEELGDYYEERRQYYQYLERHSDNNRREENWWLFFLAGAACVIV